MASLDVQRSISDSNAVQGRYLFKLLAVDVPSAAGPEQRIYLEGDQRTYNRGAVLREMRDPLLNVNACLPADTSDHFSHSVTLYELNVRPARSLFLPHYRDKR